MGKVRNQGISRRARRAAIGTTEPSKTAGAPAPTETAPTPGTGPELHTTRYERSRGWAEKPGAGHPLRLGKAERRQHVTQLLTQDHAAAMVEAFPAVQTKFAKLEESPFVFFRGTAALFYRDLAGMDATAPRVLLNGDVHPENFGISEGENGTLQFGVNDFDESTEGPFSFDVRRGAVGFDLLARQSGLSKKQRKDVVDAFVEGYVDGLERFVDNKDEYDPAFVKKGAPDVLESTFKRAAKKSREALLKRFTADGAFVKSEDIAPIPERIGEFQRALDGVRDSQNLRLLPGFEQAGINPTIKDVAIKYNSGTGALDKQRYYVLVEGPSTSNHDDIILEFKESGQSVIDRQRPMSLFGARVMGAQRVVAAQSRQLAGGDRMSGHTALGGATFLVRERNPHKTSVKVDQLSAKDMVEYAQACGHAVAHAHARSDETIGHRSGAGIEKRILQGLSKKDFREEMVGGADDYADQVVDDHQGFCEARKRGAL